MIAAFCLGEGFGGVTLMGVVRSLGRMKIPVSVLSDRTDSPASFSRYCSYQSVPNAERDPEALERALLDAARHQKERPALFVVGDAEALFVADRLPSLRRYYRINLPSSQLIRALVDKRSQYRMMEGLGVPMPATYHDVTSRTARLGEFEFPLLIKPAVSAQWQFGRLKGILVTDASQLEDRLRALERADAPAVVQSMIPGPASLLYTVLAYISQTGKPMIWGTYRKVRQYPADFGLAAVAETVSVPALEESALRLLRDLHYTGVCGIEFKKDPRDGVFRFIEMNPRFELSNSLLDRAGADVALAMYSDLTGCAAARPRPYRAGMAWMALNLELKACRDLAARGEFSWTAWAKSLRNIRTEALLAWDDPLPGLATYLRVLRNALQPGSRSDLRPAAAAARSPHRQDSRS